MQGMIRNSTRPRARARTDTASGMRAHAADAARLLKLLGHDQRLLVLCMLVEGERSVGELNARLDLSQSALSQHLALLREEGLVRTRRQAQTIYYSLGDSPARDVLVVLHEAYCGTR